MKRARWILLSALAVSTASANAQQVAVIDSVLVAYGGSARLHEVHGFAMDGDINAPSRPVPGRFHRVLVLPDQLAVANTYGAFRELRTISSGIAMRGSTLTDAKPAEGDMGNAIGLQLARTSLPWILDTRRSDVRIVTSGDRATGTPFELLLALNDGMELRAWVDPSSFHIVRSSGTMRIGSSTTSFETRYTDFRLTEGVLFAMQEENVASGTRTAGLVVTAVKLNPVTDSLLHR